MPHQATHQPLADLLRPKTLKDFTGQSHLVGKAGVITQMLEGDFLPNMILFGPTGVGKTSLARLIAQNSRRHFYEISAVHGGVKDIRAVIDTSKQDLARLGGVGAVLFVDEIHRLSKSQQDSLLEALERGWVVLIGATTQNPSFEVNQAILSRAQVYELEPLGIEDLCHLIQKAQLHFEQKGFCLEVQEQDALLRFASGDARRLLGVLELVVHTTAGQHISITNAHLEQIIKHQSVRYDKKGDAHYAFLSALIKSIRGSDPNASLYWLARLIQGGEDALVIARRLVISASEDVGLANPTALVVATSCLQALQSVGMPEGRIILGQCVVHLANSPKSNSAYKGIGAALEAVQETGDLGVPLHLQNATTTLDKQRGKGEGYAYAHEGERHFVHQEYLPQALSGKTFYKPAQNPKEQKDAQRLHELWQGKYGY